MADEDDEDDDDDDDDEGGGGGEGEDRRANNAPAAAAAAARDDDRAAPTPSPPLLDDDDDDDEDDDDDGDDMMMIYLSLVCVRYNMSMGSVLFRFSRSLVVAENIISGVTCNNMLVALVLVIFSHGFIQFQFTLLFYFTRFLAAKMLRVQYNNNE